MKKFFDDIKSELGKISWINKRENIKSTGGVVLVTIILGVFLLIVDFVFSSITELLLPRPEVSLLVFLFAH